MYFSPQINVSMATSHGLVGINDSITCCPEFVGKKLGVQCHSHLLPSPAPRFILAVDCVTPKACIE